MKQPIKINHNAGKPRKFTISLPESIDLLRCKIRIAMIFNYIVSFAMFIDRYTSIEKLEGLVGEPSCLC